MTDSYNVTADELRQFIERVEQLNAEKADIADQIKEVMAEARGARICDRYHAGNHPSAQDDAR